MLTEHRVPLRIKRLNIERNDFPEGCPVARGTPTFAIFRGRSGVKWEEFKPQDLVGRIESEFPDHCTEDLGAKMRELQEAVSRRFQLFTQLVMWNVEMGKLEMTLAGGDSNGADESKDASFSEVVSQLMSQDMKRTDAVPENLAHLQREVDEVEHDVALLGAMLAEQVV